MCRKPSQVAPASTKVLCKFNENHIPILSIIDEGTPFPALLTAEGVQEYMTALEESG